MKKMISFLLTVFLSLNAVAQIAPQDYPPVTPEEIADAGRFSVSMAVVGPDWPLYSNWGHCAMIVTEIPSPENRNDLLDMNKSSRRMYDYGIFDMSREGFFKDFAIMPLSLPIPITASATRIRLKNAPWKSSI